MEISIIVPIYNPGKKLKKCIESILKQTYKNIEVILVNDGSTDGSLNICTKYKEKDNRIKLIDKRNEGSIKARKTGLENSTGDYVMFVDADDWVHNRIVEILYKEIIDNKCDVVVANTHKVIGNNAIIKCSNNSHYFAKEKIYIDDEIRRELVESYLYGHTFPASLFCKLYKRDILISSGKYLKNINFLGEDLFLNIEVFLKSRRVKVINKPLYYYRIGGFTSKYMSYHFEDIVNGYEIQKEVIENYYKDKKQYEYNGISIMLLNSLKTSLYNLMNSNLNYEEKVNVIKNYLVNNSIQEAITNEGSKRYFTVDYLEAISSFNTEYLYNLGEELYKQSKYKRLLKKILSKIEIL